jgi:hypothetical protein
MANEPTLASSGVVATPYDPSTPLRADATDEDILDREGDETMKYRKKPIVIEAFQMTESRRHDNSEWPNWLHEAWNKVGEGALFIDPDDSERMKLCIGTLEGVHRVLWGDWIIRVVKSELYPCKPDIFAATYEPVEETYEPVEETTP